MQPTGHVELFERGRLVHSTRFDEFLGRSCPICAERLGTQRPVVIFGEGHAHAECAKGKRALPRIGGGASISPHEGLDLTIRLLIASPWYVRLFTSQSVDLVPPPDSTLTGGTVAPYTTGVDPVVECIGSSYVPQVITPEHWDASILDEGPGNRRIVANDLRFPETTDDWGIINGFFLATTARSTGQNTGVALFYANFYDEQPLIMNGPGFTLQLTPYIQLDTSA